MWWGVSLILAPRRKRIYVNFEASLIYIASVRTLSRKQKKQNENKNKIKTNNNRLLCCVFLHLSSSSWTRVLTFSYFTCMPVCLPVCTHVHHARCWASEFLSIPDTSFSKDDIELTLKKLHIPNVHDLAALICVAKSSWHMTSTFIGSPGVCLSDTLSFRPLPLSSPYLSSVCLC